MALIRPFPSLVFFYALRVWLFAKIQSTFKNSSYHHQLHFTTICYKPNFLSSQKLPMFPIERISRKHRLLNFGGMLSIQLLFFKMLYSVLILSTNLTMVQQMKRMRHIVQCQLVRRELKMQQHDGDCRVFILDQWGGASLLPGYIEICNLE